jgi:plastocyanin
MKKINPKIIAIALVVIILIVIAVMVSTNKKPEVVTPVEETTIEQTTGTNTPNVETPIAVSPGLPEGTRVDVVGGNPITKDNKVITATGERTDNDVSPMSPLAPQQTAALQKYQIPNSALKLSLSAGGFTPRDITAKVGEPITLAVTSVDGAHTFLFDSPTLSAVNMGINPGETRAVTFDAPVAGEYTFRCNIPGHDMRGETGKLIVK